MLYIESFFHRVELAEIVARWMVNHPLPGDVYRLKTILNFNSYASRIWVKDLIREQLGQIYPEQDVIDQVCKTKGELKDLIVQYPQLPLSQDLHQETPQHSAYTASNGLANGVLATTPPNVRQLVAAYNARPEKFFRGTPLDGHAYFVESSTSQSDPQPISGQESKLNERCYVGSTRFKRFRRISEKGSRRIVDYIRKQIEDLKRSGQIDEDEDSNIREFIRLEESITSASRAGTIHNALPLMAIPDVVGIKIVADETKYDHLIDALTRSSNCSIIETERHSGIYNATNLKIEHRVDKKSLLNCIPRGGAKQLCVSRGLKESTLEDDYLRFIESAEESCLVEIIVSSYDELVESEIGRGMHEERIFAQRLAADYNTQLATNVFYLLDYMLSLCLAPGCEDIDDVPIKLWYKYMPDTIDALIGRLFNIPVDASLGAI